MSCRWEQREAPPGTGDQPEGAASTRPLGPTLQSGLRSPRPLVREPRVGREGAGRIPRGFCCVCEDSINLRSMHL